MLMPINNVITQAISSVVAWFGQITESTGQLAMIMTFISIMVIYRFLLKPLLGGAGSDSVKKSKKSGGEDK